MRKILKYFREALTPPPLVHIVLLRLPVGGFLAMDYRVRVDVEFVTGDTCVKYFWDRVKFSRMNAKQLPNSGVSLYFCMV